MFYRKRIEELETQVSELEKKVHELAHSLLQQSKEIDQLHLDVIKWQSAMAVKQEQNQTKKPKYRPKKNGKENTATE